MKAPITLLGALGALCLMPMQAAAISLPTVGYTTPDCNAGADFAPAAASPVQQVGMSKSDAILGGAGSALDRIRNQQAGLALPVPASLRTAPDGVTMGASICNAENLILPSLQSFTEPQALATLEVEPDDGFLASGRIPIRRTSFTRNWERVSSDELSATAAQNLLGFETGAGTERLQQVNRWVNRTITYGEDRVIWGSRDYWASADETITLGLGDCEDIAIVKYHMLLALGVDRRDLFLTLARDLARNADHAVLVVRENGRFYLLDNSVDAILPANVAYDYRPTLSFNSESAWLHGAATRPQPTSTTYLSVNAISSPRVMGFSR